MSTTDPGNDPTQFIPTVQIKKPKKRHPVRWTVIGVIAFGITISIIGAAHGSNTVKLAPAPKATAQAPAASPPSPAPAATPSQPLSGPVDTTYKVTDDKDNVMNVTLTQIIDPAQGADEYSTPDNGKRFVGAVFTLTGVSGTFSDDANSDAVLIGANGQTYQPDFNSIAGYTNFNSGMFNLTAGQKLTGAVTFQIPQGVKVASIQWNASVFGGPSATWTAG
jgi:hypothetical protein